jgi:hypothetical protein
VHRDCDGRNESGNQEQDSLKPGRVASNLRGVKGRCPSEDEQKDFKEREALSHGILLSRLALQLPFCFDVRAPSDRLMSSAPE